MLKIPSKLPKEITDKYSVVNNTFLRVAKNDPRDKLEVEVGDIKQADFFPQIKLKRWDNECNYSVRLIDTEISIPRINTLKDKIIWDKGNIQTKFYDLTEGEGGYEFEVLLKEKPLTNKIRFTLQDKDVEYFYQPPLTQREIDRGAKRPENVVGSYAVYTKTPKTNWKGGKLYRAGKVGHIYRPKITDNAGDWTWGELNISNGILTITIDQTWLDNAVYPVKVDPTFGYDTAGGSYYDIPESAGEMRGSKFIISESGTMDSMSFYGGIGDSDDGSEKRKIGIYDGTTFKGSTLEAEEDNYLNYNWYTYNKDGDTSLSALTEYGLILYWGGGTSDYSRGRFYYDNGDTNQGEYETGAPYPTWSDPASFSNDNNKYSIYATYTAGETTAYSPTALTSTLEETQPTPTALTTTEEKEVILPTALNTNLNYGDCETTALITNLEKVSYPVNMGGYGMVGYGTTEYGGRTESQEVFYSPVALRSLLEASVQKTAALNSLLENTKKRTAALLTELENQGFNTAAVKTLLEATKQSVAALITSLEKEGRDTTAIKTLLEKGGKDTTALNTLLETTKQSVTALITSLETEGRDTTALHTLLETTEQSATALITSLEKERKTTAAIKTLLEKTQQLSTALYSLLETSSQSTAGILTILQYQGISPAAIKSILEKGNQSTTALYSALEKISHNTVSILTTLQKGQISSTALLSQLESRQYTTTALSTTLIAVYESSVALSTTLQKGDKKTVALRSQLERKEHDILGIMSKLEREAYLTTAVNTTLEGEGKSTASLLSLLETTNSDIIGINSILERITQTTIPLKTTIFHYQTGLKKPKDYLYPPAKDISYSSAKSVEYPPAKSIY